jgi:hypothetical protein
VRRRPRAELRVYRKQTHHPLRGYPKRAGAGTFRSPSHGGLFPVAGGFSLRLGRALALLCAGLLCLASAAAWAQPTGLNTIPTPDLVPPHEYNGTVQNFNTSLDSHPLVFQRPVLLPQLQLGLNDHFEAGADMIPGKSPGKYTAQLNVKWKAIWEDYDRPALGIGVVQPLTDFSPSYYLVATRTLNINAILNQRFRAHHRNIKLRGRRIHAGITRTPGGTFPLLGTDLETSDQFVIYSDWISGSPNALTIGGVYVINDQNSLTASLLYGNHPQRINGLLFNYSRTAKW